MTNSRGQPASDSRVWRDYAEAELAKAAHTPNKGPWSPSPPSQATIDRAHALIKAIRRNDLFTPMASTGSDGVFCLEWRKTDRKLAFFVYEDGLIEFYVATPRCPRAEGEIRDQWEQANEAVDTFLSQ